MRRPGRPSPPRSVVLSPADPGRNGEDSLDKGLCNAQIWEYVVPPESCWLSEVSSGGRPRAARDFGEYDEEWRHQGPRHDRPPSASRAARERQVRVDKGSCPDVFNKTEMQQWLLDTSPKDRLPRYPDGTLRTLRTDPSFRGTPHESAKRATALQNEVAAELKQFWLDQAALDRCESASCVSTDAGSEDSSAESVSSGDFASALVASEGAIVDSGAAVHIVPRQECSAEELANANDANFEIIIAKGVDVADKEVEMFLDGLGFNVDALVLPDSPKLVSLGRLVLDHGYKFIWSTKQCILISPA